MRSFTGMLIVAAIAGVVVCWPTPSHADPPADATQLRFELVDGTIINGPIEPKKIPLRLSSGNILHMPPAAMKELTIGINDHGELVRRVESMIKELDSDKTRPNAIKEILALGPAAAPLVTPHYADETPARRAAVRKIMELYKVWPSEHPEASEAMFLPLEPRSRILTARNKFLGSVAVDEFRITGPYGPLAIKVNDIYRIAPLKGLDAVRPASRRLGRWGVVLGDKTRLDGMVTTASLRMSTRYGTIAVPFKHIRNLKPAADGKSFRLQNWNSDRISGTLDADAKISIDTLKGRLDVPVGKIAEMTYGPVTLRGHTSWLYKIAISPDGKQLVSGSNDKIIKFWDIASGKELFSLVGPMYASWVQTFSPDGKQLASGHGDGTIVLWDIAARQPLGLFKGHLRGVESIVFSPDGRRLMSGSCDTTIKIWDIASRKTLFTIKAHPNSIVYSLALSPDGKRLASSASGGVIKLWDVATRKELLKIQGHFACIHSIAFSPDGKRLVSASHDKTVKLWDPLTGKNLLTMKGHAHEVWAVAFSPDGKRLLSGCRDHSLKLWDSFSGKELFTLKGHSHGVKSVVFTPDGKRMAASSHDKTITIWDALDWSGAVKQ